MRFKPSERRRLPAGASPPPPLSTKKPRGENASGTKNIAVPPRLPKKIDHLTELKQARCHGNGASRSNLLDSVALLRSETFPSVPIGLHRPPTLCRAERRKINSINAFLKKLYHTIARKRCICQAFFRILAAQLQISLPLPETAK